MSTSVAMQRPAIPLPHRSELPAALEFPQDTEAERLAAFRALSYEEYKQGLIGLHLQAAPEEGIRFTDVRTMARISLLPGANLYRYPDVTDKDAVLSYGLAAAQACDSLPRAAFVASVNIFLAHPFIGGHKRLIRNFYLDLVGGLSWEAREASGLVAPPLVDNQPGQAVQNAMDAINVSDAFKQPEIIALLDQRVYERTALRKIPEPMSFFMNESHETDEAALQRTRERTNRIVGQFTEIGELSEMLGRYLTPPYQPFKASDVDIPGLTYALSYLAQEGYFQAQVYPSDTGPRLVIWQALEQLIAARDIKMPLLIRKIWEYHRLKAEVGTALVASDELIDGGPHRGMMSTYDFIRERCAHAEASRISNPAASILLQRVIGQGFGGQHPEDELL